MNKSKLIVIVMLLSLFAISSQAQLIQLFNENFSNNGSTFTLNGTGVGTNTGPNNWIVNDHYFPTNFALPATMDEDQVCGNGHITGAPFGKYLHINNATLATNTNSDYDPTVASDRFVYLTNGVCTMGMDSVTIAFFYNCFGSSSAYAQVYYSIDNGASWHQTGQPQYFGVSACWQYETITDPTFRDKSSLQIGFRWLNTATSDTVAQAMGIDDIFIVGVPRPNITDSITQIFPNPVCQNSSLFFQVALSDTLCDGTYQIQLSDSTGNFGNLQANYVFDIFNPQTTAFLGINITSSMHTGPCYRIRINRLYPLPAFQGQPSPCIVVQECPNTITTLQPVVTMDTNAVCVGSVIDIPFYSSGTFHFGNNYVAQLSDSSGNFPTSPIVINTNFGDSTTYVYPPGTVSGVVPDVPDGCHYYIRVVSTNPTCIGTLFGPFCIQHCDINTNEHQSMAFCLTPNDTVIDYCLDVDVHSFTNNQVYAPDNIFKIELHSMMNFALIGMVGALGQQAATSDTLVCIHIAGLAGLSAMGIAPGAYYLRVIATHTFYGDSALGNLIHFTIGAPPDTGLTVTGLFYNTFDSIKGHVCPGDILLFEPHPWDFTAKYEWYGNFVGDSLSAPDIAITIGGSFFDFIVRVREISFGCRGPVSAPDTVIVDGLPQVNISAPTFVCKGDTNQWIVPYGQNTYYDWTTFGDTSVVHVLDTANNTIRIRYDSVGVYQLKVFAVNHCGSAQGQKNITVKDYPKVMSPLDTTVCSSASIKLLTPSGTGYHYNWYNNTGTLGIADSLMVNTPTSETIYLQVTVLPGNCISYDTVHINILQAQTATHHDSLCIGDTLSLNPSHTGATYNWSTGANTHQIQVSSSGTYVAIVSSPDSLCAALDTFQVAIVAKIITNIVDSICVGDTITLNANNSGASYHWTGGETSQQIKVSDGGTYIAQIHLPGNVCTNLDSFTVIQPTQHLNGTVDSLCPGDELVLTAATDPNAVYFWSPGGETTQQITVMVPGTYYSHHIAPGSRCYDADTFHIYFANCGVMTLPNVFSPNGDGKNDFFLPFTVGVYTTFRMDIYNRWGMLIWTSNDPAFMWPGTNRNGDLEPDGTYYYIANTTYHDKAQAWHGYVTLIAGKK